MVVWQLSLALRIPAPVRKPCIEQIIWNLLRKRQCMMFRNISTHLLAKSEELEGYSWAIIDMVGVITHFWVFCDPLDYSPPGSSVMGFPRQECWSGLPFPTPGDFSNPGIFPTQGLNPHLLHWQASLALTGGYFTTPPGKPLLMCKSVTKNVSATQKDVSSP